MTKLNSILIIDDDPINNFISKKFLSDLKIANEIKVALNGKEALEQIKRELANLGTCPELILCDIKMPIMNGFEFMKEFQKINFPKKSQVITVMVTTSNYPADREQAGSLGFHDYVNKPLTKPKISDLLNKYFSEAQITE